MRTASANYNTYNGLAYKKPVFAVEFSGVNTKFVSDVFADIGSPPGGVTYKKYLKNVRFNQGELDIFTPSYISGTYVLSIVDIDDEVIAFLNSASIFDLTATIKFGFQEIAYADFVNLTTGGAKVKDYYLNSDLLTWDIECRDGLLDLLDFTLGDSDTGFVGSRLDTELLSADTSIVTAGLITMCELTDLTNNLDNRVYPVVKINSEIIKYETNTSGTLGTLNRPIGGTTSPSSHAVDTPVYWGLGFSCDPLRVMLHLIMSTSAGTNGKYDFDSDNNLSQVGILNQLNDYGGLTTSELAVENIERLGWRLFNYIEYNPSQSRFYFVNDGINMLDHIQNNLLKPYGLFLMIRDGKIDVGSNDYLNFYENFSSDYSITSANIRHVNSFKHVDTSQVVYNAVVESPYNHADKTFSDQDIVVHNSNAITFYPQAGTLDINLYSLNSGADDDITANWIKYRFLSFADLSTLIDISCNHTTILLEPGDTPDVTLSQLPNENSGARGWSAVKTLLVGQDFDFLNNSFRHTLRVFAMPNFVENEVTSYYTVNKVTEGSINDTALTVSTDETATTEAADAYYDNSSSNYNADLIIFFIRVTPPAYGAGSTNEIINLKISWLDNVPAIQNYDYKPYIAFNPQASTAFTVPLYLYGASASADTPDSVKVDWISTTATGSEVPTVEFVEVWFCVCNL